MGHQPRISVEHHRRQFRTRWRENGRKITESFTSREDAERFRQLAVMVGIAAARAWVHGDQNPAMEALSAQTAASRNDALETPVALSAAASARPELAATAAVLPALTGAEVGVTYEQLFKRYLKEQRHLEDITADGYTSYHEIHYQPFFGSVDIGLIRRRPPLREADRIPGAVYVSDFADLLMTKPKLNNVRKPRPGTLLSAKTIKNIMSELSTLLQFAVDDDSAVLKVNPASNVKLPKLTRREMHFLDSLDAYLALREQMDPHFRPLLDVLVGTGVRFGEAAGLQIRHVHLDVDKPFIDIRQALKWRRGGKRLGRPKTRSSIRRIRLSPKLVAVLLSLTAGRDPDDFVFTMKGDGTAAPGPLHHSNFYSRYFQPAVRAAAQVHPRVAKTLRVHDLRHTHAAWLINAGHAPLVIQRRLGHSSYTVTNDIYGHLFDETVDRLLDDVDRLLPDLLPDDDEGAVMLTLSKRDRELPEFEDLDDCDDLAA